MRDGGLRRYIATPAPPRVSDVWILHELILLIRVNRFTLLAHGRRCNAFCGHLDEVQKQARDIRRVISTSGQVYLTDWKLAPFKAKVQGQVQDVSVATGVVHQFSPSKQ